MTTYVDEDDLLAAAAAVPGGPPAVRDAGLLSSAVGRPQASVLGTEAYPGIHQKAAALLDSVVKNHAFVDGNRQVGWVAVRLFYAYNGHTLRMDHDEAYQLVMAIASSEPNDVATIAARLSTCATPG
ncbi:type II toxin-antitoxin system death-on-curing family toxin [Isoptericola croceus]|uniref:type II toxin-antitoxin system death-on-curing family toxin n=1 Tax=Isoptericola croceus TaxID=3031406 RepID=UPI0023F83527|nr:type II toxin-antitoxin system death-on-curing family toxin [Isoptericola croceus]